MIVYVPACLVTQFCLTICDTMDYSLPGSSVHGILQARILKGVAISYSREFLTQRLNLCLLHLLHWQVDSLPLSHLGSSNIEWLAYSEMWFERKRPPFSYWGVPNRHMKLVIRWGQRRALLRWVSHGIETINSYHFTNY